MGDNHMRQFVLFFERLKSLPVAVASIALFVLMVMTFADVMLRSIFNSPIEAATELTRILMAILVFSVLPVISARGEHILVDLTDPVFDRFNLAHWRDGTIKIVSGILMIWPVQRLYVLTARSMDYGDVTEYLAIPQYYINSFITAATALTALVLVVRGIIRLVAPDALEDAR